MKRKQMEIWMRILLAVLIPVAAAAGCPKESHPYNSSEGEKGADRGLEYGQRHRKKAQEKRMRLMEKILQKIGVSEEQKARILKVQKKLKANMKQKAREVEKARRKLLQLQENGGSEHALYQAVDAVSGAQSEQLKLLVQSRIEMEKILGRKKYLRFMESIRSEWREHGRCCKGYETPPRPGFPPLPGSSSKQNKKEASKQELQIP